MFRVLLLGLVLVSSPAVALTPVPGCVDDHNNQVFIRAESRQWLWNHDAGTAVATYENNTPTIVYDRETFPELSSVGRLFTIWHECGHFRLGHSRLMVLNRINLDRTTIEDDADCYSIKKLHEFGIPDTTTIQMLSKDFDVIAKSVENWTMYQRTLRERARDRTAHAQSCQ